MALLILAVGSLILYFVFQYFQSLLRNIADVKKSGFTYVVMPINVMGVPWRLIGPPFIALYNSSWIRRELWPSWCMFLDWNWPPKHGHKPFAERGTEAIFFVYPYKIQLFIADADALLDISNRHGDFPKPLEVYQVLNIYGENIISTEGAAWRQHRKIIAPSFAEKNNLLVWKESLHQVDAMIKSWAWTDKDVSATVKDLAKDTMQVALYVVSRAGFGVRALWPHEKSREGVDQTVENRLASSAPPPNHKMTYTNALGTLLDRLLVLMVTPRFLQERLPIRAFREATQSFDEWGAFMKELFEAKKEALRKGTPESGNFDLLGALIRGAGISATVPEPTLAAFTTAYAEKSVSATPGQLLSDSEILGDAFVFILAGHETTANTLFFSILLLALHPRAQRALQHDLDRTLGGRPPSAWDYHRDSPRLLGGMPAAVMHEALRLFPPVSLIPKSTAPGQPQALTVAGCRHVIPGGAWVSFHLNGLHKNPRLWPAARDPVTGEPDIDDLDRFRPGRWIVDNGDSGSGGGSDTCVPQRNERDQEEMLHDGTDNKDATSGLWRPPAGAFLPFSAGQRSCVGRRFAQVEAVAVLASMFSRYSVELAVRGWGSDGGDSDEEVERMGPEERRALWERPRKWVEGLLRENVRTELTLQLKTKVPLRFVKRGHERFDFDV